MHIKNNIEAIGAYPTPTENEKHEWSEIGPDLECKGNSWSVEANPILKMGNPNIEVKMSDPMGAKSSMSKGKKPLA